MTTPVFGLTADELQSKIAPHGGAFRFTIGSGSSDSMTEDEADEILMMAEEQVLDRLDHRYRDLLSAVDGEYVVLSASGGETEVVLGLKPVVDGSVKIYVNYFDENRGWNRRNSTHALPVSDYSVNTTTGVVTLGTPLSEDDTVIAEYEHTAGHGMRGLRENVKAIAAAEVARRQAYFQTAEGWDRFDAWETSAWQNVNRMAGIGVIDKLKLVEETENPFSGLMGG